jgi:hypothetical protein
MIAVRLVVVQIIAVIISNTVIITIAHKYLRSPADTLAVLNIASPRTKNDGSTAYNSINWEDTLGIVHGVDLIR